MNTKQIEERASMYDRECYYSHTSGNDPSCHFVSGAEWALSKIEHQNKELIEALNRISAYQSIETLQKNSEKDWGLEYEEALEMSYENMQNEAKAILKTNKK